MIGGKEIIHKVHTHTQEEGFNSLTNLMLKLPEVYIPIFYIFYDTERAGKGTGTYDVYPQNSYTKEQRYDYALAHVKSFHWRENMISNPCTCVGGGVYNLKNRPL